MIFESLNKDEASIAVPPLQRYKTKMRQYKLIWQASPGSAWCHDFTPLLLLQ